MAGQGLHWHPVFKDGLTVLRGVLVIILQLAFSKALSGGVMFSQVRALDSFAGLRQALGCRRLHLHVAHHNLLGPSQPPSISGLLVRRVGLRLWLASSFDREQGH